MKNLILTFHFICLTAIVKGQSHDFVVVPQNNMPTANVSKESTGIISGNSHGDKASKALELYDRKTNRSDILLAGYVSMKGKSGIHFEAVRVYQPRGFGFGAYTSFIRIPEVNYSNWTIAGLHLRAGAADGEIKPYGVFDFGILNLTYNDRKTTLRTGAVGLGCGIEKSIGKNSSFLFDVRLKHFFDYKSERDAITMWTFNAGFKF
jgi:hypothetical protein